MTIAIMQPYILPYIGYLQLMATVDKFILYDDVNFINRGWINRNRMLVNGQDFMFTVPLKNASQNKLINEIELSEDIKWREKLLKTVEQAYKKAPQFAIVYDLIEQIINSKSEKITDFVSDSFVILNGYLEIKTEIVRTSAIYNNSRLKAQERILDICKQEQAQHYINPIGGMELYSRAFFEESNIKLNFIKSKPIHYQQFKNEFVPWLSILDILMFCDVPTIKAFLLEFELV
jgi:WbqC-like protein family